MLLQPANVSLVIVPELTHADLRPVIACTGIAVSTPRRGSVASRTGAELLGHRRQISRIGTLEQRPVLPGTHPLNRPRLTFGDQLFSESTGRPRSAWYWRWRSSASTSTVCAPAR